MVSAPEMNAPPSRSPAAALASGACLLLLCWLAFFNGLGELGLTDKTEALFVEVARGMLSRHDWVTPLWNGEPFFDYPVWGYWMVAISFRLFGISEWAARLPVALAASAVVVASFGLILVWDGGSANQGQRLLRALLAAGVLATSPGWIGWGRTSTTDMFLASAITLALHSFLLAHRPGARPALAATGRAGFALFSAIAVLAKGPVGLLLPGLVIVVFLSLTGQWQRWLRPLPLLAMLALFCGVCLPWYAAATVANGAPFLGGFLGFSNLQRFTSVLYSHPGPPWFYLPWLLLLLLPWSLFLPAAVAQLRFWRWSRWRQAAREPGLELPLFLLLWLLLMVAFFSAAATKLPGYILPALPAASLLVSLWWRPLPPLAPANPRALALSGLADVLVLALLTLAAAVAPRWAATDPAHPGFAAALSASGLPLRLAVLLGLSTAAAGLLLARRSLRPWLWTVNLGGFVAILGLVIAPLAPVIDRERQLPIRQLARSARQLARPAEPLWVIGTKRYSVLFYGGETAVFLSDRGSIDPLLRGDPARLGLQPGSRSVRLLGDRRDLEALGYASNRVQRLAQHDQQELWRLRREDLES
jgi:4-amino-4-deoxy-L-arabinose transferase-like glycosyltransferase